MALVDAKAILPQFLKNNKKAIMSTSVTQMPFKERISSYLYFGSLYFFTIGILYLWGYWSTFEVNVLEYINLTDVLKLTAYPIASAFVFFVVGAVLGELISGPVLPSGGARNTLIGRLLIRLKPLIIICYVVGTLALFLFGPIKKWQVLPVLFALPVYVAAKERGLFLTLLPHEGARSIVIFLLAVLPIWAYGHGRLQSAAVFEGTDYKYLAINSVEGLSMGDPSSSNNRVKFVGQINEYIFLLSFDNSTLIVSRFDKTRGLYLKRFRASKVENNILPTTKGGAADTKR